MEPRGCNGCATAPAGDNGNIDQIKHLRERQCDFFPHRRERGMVLTVAGNTYTQARCGWSGSENGVGQAVQCGETRSVADEVAVNQRAVVGWSVLLPVIEHAKPRGKVAESGIETEWPH